MRALTIIFIILVSLSTQAQRSTHTFYKIGVYQVDADDFYVVGDTIFKLGNGEVRFVGNYVTFDYGEGLGRFYSIVENKHEPPEHSHILWSKSETAVALWVEGTYELLLSSVKPNEENLLTVVTHYLTHSIEYSGGNEWPDPDSVRIIKPKSKDNKTKSYY